MALIACKECKAQISSGAKICPQCGKSQRMGAGTGCLLLLVGFGVLSSLVNRFSGIKPDATSASPSTISAVAKLPPPSLPAITTKKDVTLNFIGRKVGFGDILEVDFTIKNGGPQAIKDIQITCRHSAGSGTVMDQNTRTIYEIVKAKSKRTFANFNMGLINSQVQRSNCEIDDFVIIP